MVTSANAAKLKLNAVGKMRRRAPTWWFLLWASLAAVLFAFFFVVTFQGTSILALYTFGRSATEGWAGWAVTVLIGVGGAYTGSQSPLKYIGAKVYGEIPADEGGDRGSLARRTFDAIVRDTYGVYAAWRGLKNPDEIALDDAELSCGTQIRAWSLRVFETRVRSFTSRCRVTARELLCLVDGVLDVHDDERRSCTTTSGSAAATGFAPADYHRDAASAGAALPVSGAEAEAFLDVPVLEDTSSSDMDPISRGDDGSVSVLDVVDHSWNRTANRSLLAAPPLLLDQVPAAASEDGPDTAGRTRQHRRAPGTTRTVRDVLREHGVTAVAQKDGTYHLCADRDRRRALRRRVRKELGLTRGQCAGPYCTRRGLERCSKCKAVSYCSKECQSEHWYGGHKEECKRIRKEAKQEAKRLEAAAAAPAADPSGSESSAEEQEKMKGRHQDDSDESGEEESKSTSGGAAAEASPSAPCAEALRLRAPDNGLGDFQEARELDLAIAASLQGAFSSDDSSVTAGQEESKGGDTTMRRRG